jgi:tRNA(Ile)-lysidine synthase
VSAADERGEPIADRELQQLFQDFQNYDRILIAVSGGPDSTALLWLLSRWRSALKKSPQLVAATVDHRLRPEAKAEAATVGKFARRLKIPHHILVWSKKKPKSGIQEAARDARYRLLVDLARNKRADAIVTAHTLDDQAETLLHRIGRGSGLSGLAGIRKSSVRDGVSLLRPLIGISKVRLVATLRKAHISFANDPSNRDPRFLRPRLRKIAPELAREGIDAARLSVLAKRFARANEAIEKFAADEKQRVLVSSEKNTVEFDARGLFDLPAEISLRILGGTIGKVGHEGPVELGKLEALHDALAESWAQNQALKRTLAGAVINLDSRRLVDHARLSVGPAPLRRGKHKKHPKRRVQGI